MIRKNWETAKKTIEEACGRAGRDPEQVRLIAVGKTMPAELLQEAYDAGARDFGENKVQELLEKIPQLPEDIRWHMIGHLQRNKVRSIVGKAFLIHSVDSLRLAEEISREAVKKQVTARILLEVNVAGEEGKYGVSLRDAPALAEAAAALPGIRVEGLMTVAPFVEDGEDNRVIFQKLKQLSVDIERKNIDNISMDVLSMGMTGDYAVAVEEGATCVRVGTGLFGQRAGSNRLSGKEGGGKVCV